MSKETDGHKFNKIQDLGQKFDKIINLRRYYYKKTEDVFYELCVCILLRITFLLRPVNFLTIEPNNIKLI